MRASCGAGLTVTAELIILISACLRSASVRVRVWFTAGLKVLCIKTKSLSHNIKSPVYHRKHFNVSQMVFVHNNATCTIIYVQVHWLIKFYNPKTTNRHFSFFYSTPDVTLCVYTFLMLSQNNLCPELPPYRNPPEQVPSLVLWSHDLQ